MSFCDGQICTTYREQNKEEEENKTQAHIQHIHLKINMALTNSSVSHFSFHYFTRFLLIFSWLK